MSVEIKFRVGDHYLETILEKLTVLGISTEPIHPDISSKDLIDYINRNIVSPGLEHYNLIQQAWFREHAWNLNERREEGEAELTPDVVVMNWVTSEHQVKHHKEYAETYIFGQNLKNSNVRWTNAYLKRLAKEVDVSDKYLFIQPQL